MLAQFFSKMAHLQRILSSQLALACLGGPTQIGLGLFCLVSPKVANLNTVVTVACHRHFHIYVCAKFF